MTDETWRLSSMMRIFPGGTEQTRKLQINSFSKSLISSPIKWLRLFVSSLHNSSIGRRTILPSRYSYRSQWETQDLFDSKLLMVKYNSPTFSPTSHLHNGTYTHLPIDRRDFKKPLDVETLSVTSNWNLVWMWNYRRRWVVRGRCELAIGQNPLGTGRFPRRDRRRCSIIKETLDDCRIENELDWLLRRSTTFVAALVLVVLVVAAAKASDCRVASVVGGNSPANDERRTCLIQRDIKHIVHSAKIHIRFLHVWLVSTANWSFTQMDSNLCLFRDTEMGNRMSTAQPNLWRPCWISNVINEHKVKLDFDSSELSLLAATAISPCPHFLLQFN